MAANACSGKPNPDQTAGVGQEQKAAVRGALQARPMRMETEKLEGRSREGFQSGISADFDAMDTNKDGFVTAKERHAFVSRSQATSGNK